MAPPSYPSDLPDALEESYERRVRTLSRRERLVELVVGGAFAVAAIALLLAQWPAHFDWGRVAVAVVSMAVASRVQFEVGSTYTVPIEVFLVPMMFLVPAPAVPLCMAAALMLGKLPEAITRQRPAGRVLLALGDSWFALGPALVFTFADPGGPTGSDWPVYAAALAAQFAFDFGSSSLREWMNGGASLAEQASESGWVYFVDALLAPVGLAIAFGAVVRPWLLLLVLPLTGIMHFFARERQARMDYVLELGRAYRGTALVLGNVVEADDAYTGVHCEGVVALAVEVAQELKLDAAGRRNVEFGALLHDVGKIVVPKEIINKPGPLDDEEWEVMRAHTVEGQRLLDQVGGFMREVGVIVRSSHERYDGGGYPDGLVGEDIPLEARIVSACDAFNAMTTDRSYRRARPESAAIEELRRCSGTQFDPRVVEAVITVVERQLPAPAPQLDQPAITAPAPELDPA